MFRGQKIIIKENEKKVSSDEKLLEAECLHERKFSKMRSEFIMTFSNALKLWDYQDIRFLAEEG